MILAAFAGAQMGRLDRRSPVYLSLNLVGAAILAVDAYLGRQWGFFVLETVWSAVSIAGLVGLALGRERAHDAPPPPEP